MEGLTLFQAVLTVLGVLVLAYYCSRLLGKQWGKTSQSGSMRVLEHIQVGQNQKILLLQVKDKVYQRSWRCARSRKSPVIRKGRRPE